MSARGRQPRAPPTAPSSSSTYSIADDPAYDRSSFGGTIRGSCEVMCHPAEAQQRMEDRDLSVFEAIPGTGSSRVGDPPRVDFKLAVKKYKRPGAGTSIDPTTVRTPELLLSVVAYLVSLLDRHDVGFRETFLFVGDRFRAVRSDFSCQGIKTPAYVACLEAMVRFHLLAIHRLLDVDDVDATQNVAEGTKSLKSLIELYDDGLVSENEAEFRSYDLLFSLGSRTDPPMTVIRALPPRLFASPLVRMSLSVVSAVTTRDWVHLTRDILPHLPYLHACVTSRLLPLVRGRAIDALADAYRPSGPVSVARLAASLLLTNEDAAQWLQSKGYPIAFHPCSALPPITLPEEALADCGQSGALGWTVVLRTSPAVEEAAITPPPERSSGFLAALAGAAGHSQAKIVAPQGFSRFVGSSAGTVPGPTAATAPSAFAPSRPPASLPSSAVASMSTPKRTGPRAVTAATPSAAAAAGPVEDDGLSGLSTGCFIAVRAEPASSVAAGAAAALGEGRRVMKSRASLAPTPAATPATASVSVAYSAADEAADGAEAGAVADALQRKRELLQAKLRQKLAATTASVGTSSQLPEADQGNVKAGSRQSKPDPFVSVSTSASAPTAAQASATLRMGVHVGSGGAVGASGAGRAGALVGAAPRSVDDISFDADSTAVTQPSAGPKKVIVTRRAHMVGTPAPTAAAVASDVAAAGAGVSAAAHGGRLGLVTRGPASVAYDDDDGEQEEGETPLAHLLRSSSSSASSLRLTSPRSPSAPRDSGARPPTLPVVGSSAKRSVVPSAAAANAVRSPVASAPLTPSALAAALESLLEARSRERSRQEEARIALLNEEAARAAARAQLRAQQEAAEAEAARRRRRTAAAAALAAAATRAAAALSERRARALVQASVHAVRAQWQRLAALAQAARHARLGKWLGAWAAATADAIRARERAAAAAAELIRGGEMGGSVAVMPYSASRGQTTTTSVTLTDSSTPRRESHAVPMLVAVDSFAGSDSGGSTRLLWARPLGPLPLPGSLRPVRLTSMPPLPLPSLWARVKSLEDSYFLSLLDAYFDSPSIRGGATRLTTSLAATTSAAATAAFSSVVTGAVARARAQGRRMELSLAVNTRALIPDPTSSFPGSAGLGSADPEEEGWGESGLAAVAASAARAVAAAFGAGTGGRSWSGDVSGGSLSNVPVRRGRIVVPPLLAPAADAAVYGSDEDDDDGGYGGSYHRHRAEWIGGATSLYGASNGSGVDSGDEREDAHRSDVHDWDASPLLHSKKRDVPLPLPPPLPLPAPFSSRGASHAHHGALSSKGIIKPAGWGLSRALRDSLEHSNGGDDLYEDGSDADSYDSNECDALYDDDDYVDEAESGNGDVLSTDGEVPQVLLARPAPLPALPVSLITAAGAADAAFWCAAPAPMAPAMAGFGAGPGDVTVVTTVFDPPALFSAGSFAVPAAGRTLSALPPPDAAFAVLSLALSAQLLNYVVTAPAPALAPVVAALRTRLKPDAERIEAMANALVVSAASDAAAAASVRGSNPEDCVSKTHRDGIASASLRDAPALPSRSLVTKECSATGVLSAAPPSTAPLVVIYPVSHAWVTTLASHVSAAAAAAAASVNVAASGAAAASVAASAAAAVAEEAALSRVASVVAAALDLGPSSTPAAPATVDGSDGSTRSAWVGVRFMPVCPSPYPSTPRSGAFTDDPSVSVAAAAMANNFSPPSVLLSATEWARELVRPRSLARVLAEQGALQRAQEAAAKVHASSSESSARSDSSVSVHSLALLNASPAAPVAAASRKRQRDVAAAADTIASRLSSALAPAVKTDRGSETPEADDSSEALSKRVRVGETELNALAVSLADEWIKTQTLLAAVDDLDA